jgi:hypothetical protein
MGRKRTTAECLQVGESGRAAILLSYTIDFCSKLVGAEPNRLEPPSRNRRAQVALSMSFPGEGRGPVTMAVAGTTNRQLATSA